MEGQIGYTLLKNTYTTHEVKECYLKVDIPCGYGLEL